MLPAVQGFEPRQTESESGVLPLHNTAISVKTSTSVTVLYLTSYIITLPANFVNRFFEKIIFFLHENVFRFYKRTLANHGLFSVITSVSESYWCITFKNSYFNQFKRIYQPKMENATNNDDRSDATSETTVICVFIDGPAVSLNGSPIVSPITAAL